MNSREACGGEWPVAGVAEEDQQEEDPLEERPDVASEKHLQDITTLMTGTESAAEKQGKGKAHTSDEEEVEQ